jgi:hypothetical protein
MKALIAALGMYALTILGFVVMMAVLTCTGCGPNLGVSYDSGYESKVDAGTLKADSGYESPVQKPDAGPPFEPRFTFALGGEGSLILKGCYSQDAAYSVDHLIGAETTPDYISVSCPSTQERRIASGGCSVLIPTRNLKANMTLKTPAFGIVCSIEGKTATTPSDAGTFTGTWDSNTRILSGNYTASWPKTTEHSNGSSSGGILVVLP